MSFGLTNVRCRSNYCAGRERNGGSRRLFALVGKQASRFHGRGTQQYAGRPVLSPRAYYPVQTTDSFLELRLILDLFLERDGGKRRIRKKEKRYEEKKEQAIGQARKKSKTNSKRTPGPLRELNKVDPSGDPITTFFRLQKPVTSASLLFFLLLPLPCVPSGSTRSQRPRRAKLLHEYILPLELLCPGGSKSV